jgi:TolA-binding protein
MAHEKSDTGLDEIRREVIESRNLVIKTDNLLKNLHAEIKMVGKRQEDFQKRQWISSGVAYGHFAVLCIGGAVLVSSARTSTATNERERLEKRVTELSTELDKQKGELSANLQAARSANDVYRMMTTLPGDERLKGIDALVKLDMGRLTNLEKQALSDRAELLRKEVGQSMFERGKNEFRRGEYTAAAADLTRFMAMNPGPADALDASFFLGASLMQTKKASEAIPHLTKFITEDKRSKTRDYAMLMLASAYEATGQPEKAADVARDAIGNYPNSEFLPQLKVRLSSAKRAMGQNAQASNAPAGAPAQPNAPANANANGQ